MLDMKFFGHGLHKHVYVSSIFYGVWIIVVFFVDQVHACMDFIRVIYNFVFPCCLEHICSQNFDTFFVCFDLWVYMSRSFLKFWCFLNRYFMVKITDNAQKLQAYIGTRYVIKNRWKILVITWILKYIHALAGAKFVPGFREIHEIKVCTIPTLSYRLSRSIFIYYYQILIKTLQKI